MGGLLNNLPIIGAGASGIGDLFGILAGFHQNSLANGIHPQWHQYQTSPYAKQQLGIAQQLFNSQMPGYTQEQQNIGNAQGSFLNSVDRNATDSAQALSLASASQGIADNAYSGLQGRQEQFKSSMLGNLNDALGTMIGEGDKSYQSMLQKYMQDTATQNGLRNNAWSNIVGGFKDIGSTAISYDNFQKSGK